MVLSISTMCFYWYATELEEKKKKKKVFGLIKCVDLEKKGWVGF